MASQALKGVVGGVLAASLMFSSTAAAASTVSAPAANPWAVLSAMSGGAPAATMCGAAAAVATQTPTGCVLPALDAAPPPPAPVAAPPPPPPVETAGGLGISPLILGLLALAAGIGIFLAVNNNSHSDSPA